MEFAQTKNKKLRKVWRCGDYRITVNRKPFGVRVPLRYYACVHTTTGWDFAAHRRPYRKLEAAIKACETNEKFWDRFRELAAESGSRLRRLEDLIDRAKRQKVYMTVAMPIQIAKTCDKRLMEMLNPKPRTKVEDDDECPTFSATAPSADKSTPPITLLEPSPGSDSAPDAGKKLARQTDSQTSKGTSKQPSAQSSPKNPSLAPPVKESKVASKGRSKTVATVSVKAKSPKTKPKSGKKKPQGSSTGA